MNDHLKKLPKAFACGVLGSIIGWGILTLLTDIIGWHYLASAAVSLIVNVSFNFVANDVWTFRGVVTNKSWIRRYTEFWAVYGAGAGVDYGLLALFTSVVGIDHKISWWIAVAAVGFLRYIGMYYWTFHKRRFAKI